MLPVRLKCSWPKTSTNWNIIMDVTFIVIACIQMMKIDETITPRRSCKYTLQNGESKKTCVILTSWDLEKLMRTRTLKIVRSSLRRRCYFKKAALKNFCKIHRKTPLLSLLFNNIVNLRHETLFKKRPQRRCFPLNFAKFLRTPIFYDTYEWQLLNCNKS